MAEEIKAGIANHVTNSHAPKIGVSTWITIGSFVIALLGVGGALLTQLFTSREQFSAHEMANVKAMSDIQGANELRDWKIQNISVTVGNLEARQTRIDANVVKLLTRFGAQPVPEPAYQDSPPAPAPAPVPSPAPPHP